MDKENNSSIILCFLLFAILCQACLGTQHWSYEGEHGPRNWKDDYPTCGGNNQSPVDITNVQRNDSLGQLTIEGYDTKLKEATLVNNGHSAQVEAKDARAFLTGGCLTDKYTFHQFHFHWGKDNSKGSEHTVEGKAYPMEGHFVHVNSKYNNVSEAKKHPDGIAVLGVFYEVSDNAISELDVLINAIKKDQNKKVGTRVNIEKGLMMKSLLPDDMSFYCYRNGSLTTPSCAEAVIWTVLQNPVTIGQDQMNEFRKLKDANGSPLVNNFRPLQPINGRTIYSVNSRS